MPSVRRMCAGMTQALPADVQALLKRSAASPSKGRKQHRLASNTAAASPLVLELEARDPRTASDVVLQLLAFRPAADNAAAARLPAGLRSLYFTTQFYHFGPVVTEPCLLSAGEDGQGAGTVLQQQQLPGRPGEAAGSQAYVLLPTKQVRLLRRLHALHSAGAASAIASCKDHPAPACCHDCTTGTWIRTARLSDTVCVLWFGLQVQRSGAGLVFKYNVDGSAASQLLPGQAPAQAAFDGHMAFCRYLAKHRLAIDVWDADSLLQVCFGHVRNASSSQWQNP